MVKIPSLDDLKKMGTDLIDSAKTIKFNEMVDKIKTGIDSVSSKKNPAENMTDETVKKVFEDIFSAINELTQAQAAQVTATRKLEKQLEDLAKIVQNYQKTSATTSESKKEEKSP